MAKTVLHVDHVSMCFRLNKEKPEGIGNLIKSRVNGQGRFDEFWALKDVDFSIEKGDRIGILGINGAGKSTLLKVIAGVYKPTEGQVHIDGKIVPLLELGAGFNKEYTGRENVYLYGAVLGYSRSFIDSKFDEILEFSELGKFIDVPLKNYSSGMKSRLGFSIATVVDPEILILDEVLSVGDARFRKKSEDKITSMMANGVTVLFVSHNLAQVQRICNKAVILEHGQVKACGEINEMAPIYERMLLDSTLTLTGEEQRKKKLKGGRKRLEEMNLSELVAQAEDDTPQENQATNSAKEQDDAAVVDARTLTYPKMKDAYLEEDLKNIAKRLKDEKDLYGSSVLVTGATGLVGSQTVKALLMMNRLYDAKIEVYAMFRNQMKAAEMFEEFPDPGLHLMYGDLESRIHMDEKIDYVVHTASPTASKYFVEYPVETMGTSIFGTKRVLGFAQDQGVKGMVYLSSMEAFGITDPSKPFVKEDDLGYIDIHAVRSSYSESKRVCELWCSCYAAEYGIPVKIARLAQTFGAGIPYKENRVFAQFAKSAINKTDIVLHTKGLSDGNYCYTRDAVAAILLLLVKGEKGEAYTVANEESHITIGGMAEMVAEKLANNEIKVVYDIPESALTYGYAPDVKMQLNSEKLRALGWKPEVGLEEAYRRMIASMLATRTDEEA